MKQIPLQNFGKCQHIVTTFDQYFRNMDTQVQRVRATSAVVDIYNVKDNVRFWSRLGSNDNVFDKTTIH